MNRGAYYISIIAEDVRPILRSIEAVIVRRAINGITIIPRVCSNVINVPGRPYAEPLELIDVSLGSDRKAAEEMYAEIADATESCGLTQIYRKYDFPKV